MNYCELVQNLCPNGVPYKPLSELFNTRNGYTPSRNNPEYWENGTIPWFRMEDIRENGRILDHAIQTVSCNAIKGAPFPVNSIIVATSATIGEHALITVESLANQRFTYLMLKNEYKELFDIKFIYYYCFELDKYCLECLNQGNFASVDMRKFNKFLFPLPPLEVQREIVHILDSFTNLTAELSAELSARQKQYGFYREKLLNHKYQINYVPLGELAQFSYGYTEKAQDTGDTRFIRITDITDDGCLNPNGAKYITLSEDSKKYLLNRGDLLLARTGATYGKTLYMSTNEPAVYASFLIKISLDNTRLLNRFYWHFSKSQSYWNQAEKLVSKGGQQQFNANAVSRIIVPVPPLDVQQRIVNVLDNFDAICSDLNIGLPAEISARQKQYEYYRDLLLSFKNIDNITDRQTDRQSIIKLLLYVNGYHCTSISDVCKISRGKVISKSDMRNHPGIYPVYSSQTENDGVFGAIDSYMYDGEYLTWTTDGANAGTVFYRKGKFNITNVCGLLEVDSSRVNIRYLYHYLSITAKKYVSSGMGNAKLMSNVMGSIKVLLPTLPEQNRIASILDRFDTLCNDLSTGLPAEIAARQQQYEYYRDKLLTFKELT